MKFQAVTLSILFVSLAFAGGLCAATTDPVDALLAELVSGKGSGPAFYEALFKAPLYVVAEKEPPAGTSAVVFAHRVQDGKKIIDVYTSPAQLADAPEARIGKTIQMQGRELFTLIAQTGCDAGLNTYSGHGGRLTAQKIVELLKT
jgi:hypothetical protein